MRDQGRHSGAERIIFAHNNVEDLDRKLAAIDPYLKTVKALDRYHGSKNGAEHGVGANSSVVSGAARQKSQRN